MLFSDPCKKNREANESRKPESTGFETAPISASDEGVVDASLVSIFDDVAPDLRNEIGADFGRLFETKPATGGVENLEKDKVADAASRSIARIQADDKPEEDPARILFRAWVRREGPLKDRIAFICLRNWMSRSGVMDDEADALRELMAMPESPERTGRICELFGSMLSFRRCWRFYSDWADKKLVAEAEAAYGASLKPAGRL